MVLCGTLYLICSFAHIFVAEQFLLPWVYTAKAWASSVNVGIEWIDDDPNFSASEIAQDAAKSWRTDRAEIAIANATFFRGQA